MSLCITTSTFVRPFTGIVCFLYPRNEKVSEALFLGTEIEYRPFASTVVPREVPSTTTETPSSGAPLSSTTVPDTLMVSWE